MRTLREDLEEKFDGLYEQGYTDSGIARVLHCSPASVGLFRRNVKKVKSNFKGRVGDTKTTREEKFRALYDTGYSDYEIASRTGYSRDIVRTWRTKLGLSPVFFKKTKEPKPQVNKPEVFMEIRRADDKGRVTLGQKFAEKTIIIKEIDEFTVEVQIARVMTEREYLELRGEKK